MADILQELNRKAGADCAGFFPDIDKISEINTARVLDAFRAERVAEADFAPSTGYGYGDGGRDKLDRVFARAFCAEDALVRHTFINGTHTIATALYANLRPGDTLLSATGRPYDTLTGVIEGHKGEGSLEELGVGYTQLELSPVFDAYLKELRSTVTAVRPAAVLIQRSRGYSARRTLTTAEIGAICNAVKAAHPPAVTIVDNCYGEFCETAEPCAAGADLICGSLIKNPGGGLAPTGGYIAGKRAAVEACAYRLTVPGIGREAGCNPAGYRDYYRGLFLAPHTVAQALKTALFAARLTELLGYTPDPLYSAVRSDIIQTITFHRPEPLLAFCRGIQEGSPVDSFAVPEPWDMPGYDCPVVMAAGAFVQGASIELSADAPIREPYTVYIQGGLTYEAGRAGILSAARRLMEQEETEKHGKK